MHQLTSSFILGYHGCDETVAEALLRGEPFKASNNVYDWLGPGVYFWESNPKRGLEFARETSERKGPFDYVPTVIGAVIDLGFCLDLTTSSGIEYVKVAFEAFREVTAKAGASLPENSADLRRRHLDCAVIGYLHQLRAEQGIPPLDSVKGIFTEGNPAYPGAGFPEKTHIQIAVQNPKCIKAVLRVNSDQLEI